MLQHIDDGAARRKPWPSRRISEPQNDSVRFRLLRKQHIPL